MAQSYELKYLGTPCADLFDILHAVYGFDRGTFGVKNNSVAVLVAEIWKGGVWGVCAGTVARSEVETEVCVRLL